MRNFRIMVIAAACFLVSCSTLKAELPTISVPETGSIATVVQDANHQLKDAVELSKVGLKKAAETAKEVQQTAEDIGQKAHLVASGVEMIRKAMR